MSSTIDTIKTTLGVEGVGKTVLVSGVTGFLGSQVALEYLKHGFKVHATARSQEKADEWLAKHYIAAVGVKFFIVPDVAAPGAFDEAIKGVDVVAHTASPFHYSAKDKWEDMLKPAIEGTMGALRAAAKEPSVKRVVVTSSFAAVLDLQKLPNVGYTYTHADWNPATKEEALKNDDNTFLYCASKVLAEKAAWEFVEKEKPGFALSTICPPLISGPPEQVIKSTDGFNTSTASIWEIINGKNKEVPATSFPVGTDVRDIAKAHVLATTLNVAKGQRYLTIAFHFSNDQIAAALRRAFPDKVDRISAGEDKPAFEHFSTDSSKAEKELGIQWIPFEKSVTDSAAQMWKIEDQLKSQKSA